MIENILMLKRESTNFENVVVDEAFIAEWGVSLLEKRFDPLWKW